MKPKVILGILFVAFILVSCASTEAPVPTRTATVSQTSTPLPSTPTLIPTIPLILVTPLDLTYANGSEIGSIVDRLYPDMCVNRGRDILIGPTPIEPGAQLPPLKFTKLDELPTPRPLYTYTLADNIDKSRTAFSGPYDLYYRDNLTNNVYRIDFGVDSTYRMLWFDYLQWINRDTFIITEQSYRWIIIIAINVTKQQYKYYNMTPGCKP